MKRFKDEGTCEAYLEQVRWEGNPTCPWCGTDHAYRTNRGYKCRLPTCYKKFTAIVGTFLENTRVPLRKWMGAFWLVTQDTITSASMARQLNLTQKTAWYMLYKMHEVWGALPPEKGMATPWKPHVNPWGKSASE